MLWYYFSSEVVLQSWLKNDSVEKQINAKIQATIKHELVLELTGEKMQKFIVTNCKDRFKL